MKLNCRNANPVYVALLFTLISFSAEAQTQAPVAPQAPVVKQPGSPVASPPAASGAVNIGNGASSATSKALSPAPYVATRFDDASYKQMMDSGNTVLLVFSHGADAVWQRQAPILQAILKEPEFGRIAAFQIDIGAYPSIAEKFLVSAPGTILVMKSGFERLRSTRMVKADVIRKMLRLHTAL